jgi:DNA-binding Lrp family transcriptional regulator
MVQMVNLISDRGPHMDEKAREMGVHKETLRYWYRHLLGSGFKVQATLNFERLGMRRVIVLVEFRDHLKDIAGTILKMIGSSAYIVSSARIQLNGHHLLDASVPQECMDSWTEFLSGMKKVGVFKSVETVVLDWFRDVPMWAERYEFEEGAWKLDWTSKGTNPTSNDAKPDQRQKYDTLDLKMIQQMQHDGGRPLTVMKENLGVKSYKKLSWHYKRHVLYRGLIRGYRVNWLGGKVSKGKEDLTRGYVWISLIGRDLRESERLGLMSAVNRTPFVWAEGSAVRTYFAQMVFPSEEMPNVLSFLEGVISPVRAKVRCFMMDRVHATTFGLPLHNFEEKKQSWLFDGDRVLQRVEVLLRGEGFEAGTKVRREIQLRRKRHDKSLPD